MTSPESDIQWFIAREGKQHGPLSDPEMRKLIELGHLRPQDLVWRHGFPDWRPVPSVFQLAPQPSTPEPPPPAASPPATAPSAQPYAPQSAQPAPADQPQARQPSPFQPAPFQPQSQPVSRPALGTPLGTGFPTAGVVTRPAGNGFGPVPQAEARQRPDGRREREPERSGGGGRLALVSLGLLALIGSGAWVGYSHKGQILAAVSGAASGEAKPEIETAAVARTAADTDALDAQYQRRALWSAIKTEFPEWYSARLKEVAQLGAAGKTDAEITRHLVEAVVGLRRQNADKALAAGPEKHKALATAFLENLRKLSEDSAETCYGFISKGETSPGTVAIMQSPEKSTYLEAQGVAIVNAIADGKRAPTTHQPPVKADYDMLAAELGRLGWSQADMQLFADPKALAKAPHERVCKMVQDWFAAHLAIPDAAVQQRLLFETIRPVIAG